MNSIGPLVRVRAVRPLEGYRVLVTFEDQTEREIDLEPFLRGPVFEAIRRDPAVFRSVKVLGNTIAWDNGADIDPDVLYYGLKPAWVQRSDEADLSLRQKR